MIAGPNGGATGSDDASFGNTAWSQPTRIIADDGSTSGCLLAAGGSDLSHYLIPSTVPTLVTAPSLRW